jgi:TetR/AcrR family transcriptional regulator, transcriptional repressor for nem operon
MARPSLAQGAILDTPRRMLDIAERLVQTVGFNGFSYADISAELKITKASLHHHFATKADLGLALIERYTETFGAALENIDVSAPDAPGKLDRYAQLYEDVLTGKRLCLCGMLAAEYATLPKPMQDAIRRFFDANEVWLASAIEQGRKARQFRANGSAKDAARLLLGALEGAMLVAWPYNDVTRFASSARMLLADLRFAPKPAALARPSTARGSRRARR